MEDFPLGVLVALLGFGLGLAFGATALRTNFCTMGAISDMVFIGDLNRFRAWMLTIAVAVLGSQALQLFEAVDLATPTRSHRLDTRRCRPSRRSTSAGRSISCPRSAGPGPFSAG